MRCGRDIALRKGKKALDSPIILVCLLLLGGFGSLLDGAWWQEQFLLFS